MEHLEKSVEKTAIKIILKNAIHKHFNLNFKLSVTCVSLI